MKSHSKNISAYACRVLPHRVWSPLKSAFVSGREGGTDGSETGDDRSALPLMCTYLPIGELCHSGDLCLKSPTHYHFHHHRHVVPPPSRIRRAAVCTQRQSQAPLSLLSTQSGLQGKRWIYLWEKFESIIYFHSLCHCSPRGRLYCIFMNDPVYWCTQSSCFNVTQQRQILLSDYKDQLL